MIQVLAGKDGCHKGRGSDAVAKEIPRPFRFYHSPVVVLRGIDMDMVLIDQERLRYDSEPFIDLTWQFLIAIGEKILQFFRVDGVVVDTGG